jgi:putative membrane protein
MRNTRWTMVAALAAVLAAPAARADDPATQDAGKPGNRAVTDGRGGTEVQIDDQVFVTKALQGSMAEIELADMAIAKSTNPRVKEFAEQMKKDHTATQAHLAQAASREGVQQPTGLTPMQQATKDELSALQGAAFDRAYMRHMVHDHEKEVALFTAKSRTGDGDVAAIANRQVTVLHEHLEMAREVSSEVGSGNPASDVRQGSAGHDAAHDGNVN